MKKVDQLQDAKELFEYQAKGIDVEHIKKHAKRYKNAFLVGAMCVGTQTAKKPDIEGDGGSDGHIVYDTWICPGCDAHYEIDYDHYKYCPNCGQHIDTKIIEEAEG